MIASMIARLVGHRMVRWKVSCMIVVESAMWRSGRLVWVWIVVEPGLSRLAA